MVLNDNSQQRDFSTLLSRTILCDIHRNNDQIFVLSHNALH